MSLYDVSDYRLDPPEPHEESCACETCHDFHRSEGIQNWASVCRDCADILEEDISLGVRCEHGEYVPYVMDMRDKFPSIMTDLPCAQCQAQRKAA